MKVIDIGDILIFVDKLIYLSKVYKDGKHSIEYYFDNETSIVSFFNSKESRDDAYQRLFNSLCEL